MGELQDKLIVVHLKIWHIEEEIERIKDSENVAVIDKLLDQVVTLNELRVKIVASIDELWENKYE
jgi:hypothetical protein